MKEFAVVQPDAFPNPITENETRVKHRDCSLGPGFQLAIDIDKNVLVARVRNVVMCAVCH
jgi:hypothetical protein